MAHALNATGVSGPMGIFFASQGLIAPLVFHTFHVFKVSS